MMNILTIVVCNREMGRFSHSGQCTGGDRRARCTPEREVKLDSFLNVVLYFGGVRSAGRLLVCIRVLNPLKTRLMFRWIC